MGTERRTPPTPPDVEPPAPAIVEPSPNDTTGPAEARLGSAGVARLRARFADLAARIRDRVEDDARRQELKAAAERLNPDGWRTDEEVSAGLESYEATFEAVKTAIGGRKPAGQAPAAASAADAIGPDETQ